MSGAGVLEPNVDVATIERELRELWKSMAASKEGESGQAVLRACVLNLVVPASGAADQVGAVLAEVSERNPSRILILEPRPAAAPDGTSAFVTALCHLAGGRTQVCCEQIYIEGRGAGVRLLPSLVRPLLVPDLPTVLWWRGTALPEGRLFGELLQSADRLILDSRGFAEPEQALAVLSRLVSQARGRPGLGDLGWAALTPWRALASGFYDVPMHRPALARLGRVEIEYGAADGVVPVGAWLLAGWFGSRLKWKRTGALERIGDGSRLGRFLAGDRRVELSLKPRADASGLLALRLIAEGRPEAVFSVELSEDEAYLRSAARSEGAALCGKLLRLPAESEAAGISAELQILGRDAVYEAALRLVAELAAPGAGDER